MQVNFNYKFSIELIIIPFADIIRKSTRNCSLIFLVGKEFDTIFLCNVLDYGVILFGDYHPYMSI